MFFEITIIVIFTCRNYNHNYLISNNRPKMGKFGLGVKKKIIKIFQMKRPLNTRSTIPVLFFPGPQFSKFGNIIIKIRQSAVQLYFCTKSTCEPFFFFFLPISKMGSTYFVISHTFKVKKKLLVSYWLRRPAANRNGYGVKSI
jgi:hypothetical protein